MTPTPVPVVPLAGLAGHLDRLNALTMDGHFDTARLLLAQSQEGVSVPGLDELTSAMKKLESVLGPSGSMPGPNLGRALVDMTEAFERVLGSGTGAVSPH